MKDKAFLLLILLIGLAYVDVAYNQSKVLGAFFGGSGVSVDGQQLNNMVGGQVVVTATPLPVPAVTVVVTNPAPVAVTATPSPVPSPTTERIDFAGTTAAHFSATETAVAASSYLETEPVATIDTTPEKCGRRGCPRPTATAGYGR